jgi:succinoglycan biosynthesis transport protein ExoP
MPRFSRLHQNRMTHMLHINNRILPSGKDTSKIGASLIDPLQSAIKIVRCQLPIVSAFLLCSLVLALLYLFITSPKFTAEAEMVIDTRKIQVLQQQSVLGNIEIDSAGAQTQVGILNSKNVSLAVIRKLHLTEDPEFVGSGKSSRFIFGQGEILTDHQKEDRALDYFERQRRVSRQGMTYLIDLSFESLDPNKSAQIVNAIMKAYYEDQMASKDETARRASDWLLARANELRAQALATERAVIEFKEKNNIVDTGGAGPGNAQGRLLNEQQLSEVNSQLILASADAAQAKARLERIRVVMSQDVPDASVADSLKSEVIIKLRGQYLELAQREAIISQKYGAAHLAAVNLRTQMQEIRRSVTDEMRKIAESYLSDYEIAAMREASLRKSLDNVVSESGVSNQAQLQLHQLKSSADAARTFADNFLQRYMEAVQQHDSMPISEARTVSPATPPSIKSSPKLLTTLALFLFGGSLLGFAVAYFREMSESVFRTPDQVEDVLHVNCLTSVPAVNAASPKAEIKSGDESESVRDHTLAGVNQKFLRHVVDARFSRYAEAIRAIKIAADISGTVKSHKVIGVTSTLPNEGKSSIASNLAHLIADAGGSVILVDADLRRPSLTRRFAPHAPGLIEVIRGNLSLDSAIITIVPSSKLHFLPAGPTSRLPHTNEILASASMKELLDKLRAEFDYVIVDLSPVAPIADVRTTGHVIDTYVYVVEWGKTNVEAIKRGFTETQGVYDRLLGVVLNKVDMKAQSRYSGGYSYRKSFEKYGYED